MRIAVHLAKTNLPQFGSKATFLESAIGIISSEVALVVYGLAGRKILLPVRFFAVGAGTCDADNCVTPTIIGPIMRARGCAAARIISRGV